MTASNLARKHVYGLIKEDATLNAFPVHTGEESRNIAQGVIVEIINEPKLEGSPDGIRDLTKVVMIVTAYSSTIEASGTAYEKVLTAINKTNAEYDEGYIDHCILRKERSGSGRTPSDTIRHQVGGIFELIVTLKETI